VNAGGKIDEDLYESKRWHCYTNMRYVRNKEFVKDMYYLHRSRCCSI